MRKSMAMAREVALRLRYPGAKGKQAGGTGEEGRREGDRRGGDRREGLKEGRTEGGRTEGGSFRLSFLRRLP